MSRSKPVQQCLGKSFPDFVRNASAPPRVFRPNNGLEPGITSMALIAPSGIRSQFTVSPNGVLTRTPSWKTERPWGSPSNGDARKATIVQLLLVWIALDIVEIDAGIDESRRSGTSSDCCTSMSFADRVWTLAGTWLTCVPRPGTGVLPTTSTAGASSMRRSWAKDAAADARVTPVAKTQKAGTKRKRTRTHILLPRVDTWSTARTSAAPYAASISSFGFQAL